MQELIAIPGYPIDEANENLMLSAIRQLKKLNKPILVLAHCTIPESIQNEVDYVYSDNQNVLIDFSTTDIYGHKINDDRYSYPIVKFLFSSPYIDIELTNPVSRHNIVCLINLENALKFAKEKGFEWIYFVENDNLIHDLDLIKFEQIKNKLIRLNRSAYFQYYEENQIASEMYIAKVDFMLDNIEFTHDVHSYFESTKKVGSTPDLEFFLYKSFKNQLHNIYFDKLERIGNWGDAHSKKTSSQAATSAIFNNSVFNTQNDTYAFESRACSIAKSITSYDHYLILVSEQKETQIYSCKVYFDDELKYNYTFKLMPFYSYITKCHKKTGKYRYLVENLSKNTVVYDEEFTDFSHIASTVLVKQDIPLWDIESSYEPYNIGATLRDVIRENKPQSIIEFGVLNGYSTINMALEIKKLGLKSKIKAYDLWEKYPYKKTNIEYTRFNIERYGVQKYIDLEQMDFYEWCKNPEKADLYHIDISNNADIVELAIETLKDFIMEGSILLFEGGTEERDNVEWMSKYNKRHIRNIKTHYRVLNDNFPSISIIDRELLLQS